MSLPPSSGRFPSLESLHCVTMSSREPDLPPSPTLLEAPPSYYSQDDTRSLTRPPSPRGTVRADFRGPAAGLSGSQPLPMPVVQCGVRYSFSQLSANSMLLLPPPGAADSRSLYHISVHMNVFKPQSFVTVVRRGALESGPYVGEFEYGPYDRINRIVVGSTAKRLGNVVAFKSRYFHANNWHWHGLKWIFDNLAIHWEPETALPSRTLQYKCVTKDSGKSILAHLATFYPANMSSARGGTIPMPSLVIEHAGAGFGDHVLLSILVLQRHDYPSPRSD
ncbi:uncharacterized protein PHACADRAFT_211384 [Phanerochaete carnosa HHB-10118-sp]|uniref:Uncharacterized protein n=1 Tax=Phanerochaete carnosa (strain HHB-10118-sp) TaxID=650164 RepID=K5UUN0_PHACS|nr:uncharacterized protein PHACADRAFT_211384 [Phanerochaete carnosa HHB-10118-sp]EKM53721.1 hypothetical protein PHACADRAFT_211384 [Phanerochaete carnosa HHB-10118-sp]